jgi:hypothetical protein
MIPFLSVSAPLSQRVHMAVMVCTVVAVAALGAVIVLLGMLFGWFIATPFRLLEPRMRTP